MEKEYFEIDIYTGIIEYLGVENDGISLLISITIPPKYTFQGVYWFNREDKYILVLEDDFLKLFGVHETNDLPFINDIVKDIELGLPDKEEIYREFGI
jgi:hypothetical protein